MEVIVREPLLDHMLLIAAADHKLMKSVGGIHFHDMPQDRLFPDLDHWLGFQMALLADSCTKSSCQNYNFHKCSPFFFFIY